MTYHNNNIDNDQDGQLKESLSLIMGVKMNNHDSRASNR